MAEHLSVEELVVDDSFINYCHGTNDTDILYWQLYEKTHPHQKEKMEEARQMVLALQRMLAGEQIFRQSSGVETVVELEKERKKSVRRRLPVAAAAAVVLLTFFLFQFRNGNTIEGGYSKQAGTRNDTSTEMVFSTAPGERKYFTLPDSSRVYLNAGSSLRLASGFARGNRSVHLTGEALFDITHDEKHPFIVHLPEYDIKVLGTVFNVKAYPDESISETALLKGKVQILKSDGGDLTLVPNQKLVFRNREVASPKAEDNSWGELSAKQEIVSLKINGVDSAITETAWVQNRLEIGDESFSQIRGKLERWYNVRILFKDEEVKKYRFTATFRDENINEVFQALQFAYPFRYKIEGNEITVSK